MQRRWVFFTIPQSNDDFGADTWEDESWRYTGHANVWGLMSLDAGRGLLYVPTSTPSGDYWGGRRLGANLFAESLVCLDARTGERQWHFQAVHHGVWDYRLQFAAEPGHDQRGRARRSMPWRRCRSRGSRTCSTG